MAKPARLDGLLVDTARSITFTFEGAPVSGFGGDTIASALAANGQWMLSRSFKYRRPRGAFWLIDSDDASSTRSGSQNGTRSSRAWAMLNRSARKSKSSVR